MSADIEFTWQWPAERSAEQKILVQVDSINTSSGGLFSALKSPSLADTLPDAQVLSARVVNTDKVLDGKSITLLVPKLEIQSVEPGGYVVLGMVEETICICITPVDSKDVDLSRVACLR